MNKDLELNDMRGKIDAIDDRIVKLLGERFQLISQVSELKKREGIEVHQQGREDDVLRRIIKKGAALGLNELLLEALFMQIFAVSKRDQSKDQV